MREEVISSGGTTNVTPTASSPGASSHVFPSNARNADCSSYGHVSRVSISYVGSQQPRTSLSTSAGGSALGTSQLSCRPWEREDLLRRLSTFKPSNWFEKPKVVSSLSCAQRGWINTDVDKIACESCSAHLSFVFLPSWTLPETEKAGVVFANQLDTAHTLTCSWRGNSCPDSLVQFPPIPQSALVGQYKDRCDGLLQFQSLPLVASSAIEKMCISQAAQVERFLSKPPNFTVGEVDFATENAQDLEHSRDFTFCLFFHAQKLISLCGWEPRWLPNIQDCEEHSTQSARNGCTFGLTSTQCHNMQDPGPSKNGLLASSKKGTGKNKILVGELKYESKSPVLDCGLCGATVKISNFLTVPQPSRFATTNIDIPDSSKKMTLTRGVSAASGINGWSDNTEKEHIEDHDEVATSGWRFLPNRDVDINLTMAGSSSYIHLSRTASGIFGDNYIGRDMRIGQHSGSEIGNRAASYESQGPSSRKRSLEIGGSSNERTHIRIQQVDSIEGVVIDKDNDEVTDERQYSAGPSKRVHNSDMGEESSGAGPRKLKGLEIFVDPNIVSSFRQEVNQNIGIAFARDCRRASSVIAVDTILHASDDDSLDSVENNPGYVDDIHFPSSDVYGNLDIDETSELIYSNQVQQSICFPQVTVVALGEIGVSSTNVGELYNAEAVTPILRDGFSFGVSGGSVGMCVSHEAEIHGTDISVHRSHSAVDEIERKIEDIENKCQMGESAAPGQGLMDEIIPKELVIEDPQGDNSHEMSQSIERANSGSKVDDSVKAESIESGEKISQSRKFVQRNMEHPSVSCNAILDSGYYATSKEVTVTGKTPSLKDSVYFDGVVANDIGPPKGESNYEEATEFDPLMHHNIFCPWVNGNVAAAGFNSGTNFNDIALCGWQLTLDALDSSPSLAHFPNQTLPSESAASLHKNDYQNPRKLLPPYSVSHSHGQR